MKGGSPPCLGLTCSPSLLTGQWGERGHGVRVWVCSGGALWEASAGSDGGVQGGKGSGEGRSWGCEHSRKHLPDGWGGLCAPWGVFLEGSSWGQAIGGEVD